ncbi:hypothetical protein RhiJN_10401 [Ceratobasidium sp. AG-Ba]|nr:hypothetical protein RhiJN_10401 [Ceratobasidium sp. AG-Ba]
MQESAGMPAFRQQAPESGKILVRHPYPRLAGLMALTAAFGHSYQDRFQERVPTQRAIEEDRWWLEALTTSPASQVLRASFPVHDHPTYMDASTSFGIGIVVEGYVAAWKLADDWRKPGIDIGWAEMVAVELALQALISRGIRKHTVVLRSDNNGVVFAVQAGRSRNWHQNKVLMRILAAASEHELDLAISYIKSAENPADDPSRGKLPAEALPFPWPVTMPEELADILTPYM